MIKYSLTGYKEQTLKVRYNLAYAEGPISKLLSYSEAIEWFPIFISQKDHNDF